MRPSSSFTVPGILRFVYIHNPFYLISACLVLYGMRLAFSADSSLTGGWLLMALLCGYTLLLAVTGYTVIRVGRVWQDARMILLVMVLLLQILPINFEEVALSNPFAGARFELIGFLFAVAVSEGLLRGLNMRLAAMYRLPYYLILALLYFYPIPLAYWSLEGYALPMAWGVFLFPVFTAAAFLSLLVAVRRGGEREPANGTPWPWPWYPWTLFVVLMFGTALRSFELSRSFEGAVGTYAAWQPYFLIPLLLAAAVLLMELGVVNRNRIVCRIALIVPMAALLTAFPGHGSNAVQTRFLDLLRDSIGSPAHLTILGLAVFYLLAWFRKIPFAELGCVTCLLLSTVVDHQTVGLATLVPPRMSPVWAVSVLQLAPGIRHRSSWRWLAGCLLGIGAAAYQLQGTLVTEHFGYYPLHVAVVSLLVTGLIFRDRVAQVLRAAAPFMLPSIAILAACAYDRLFPDVPNWVHLQYIAVLTACGFMYWFQEASLRQLVGSLLVAGCYFLAAGRHLHILLDGTAVAKGLEWMEWGLASLGMAVLISFVKGGLIRKFWSALHQINIACRDGKLYMAGRVGRPRG